MNQKSNQYFVFFFVLGFIVFLFGCKRHYIREVNPNGTSVVVTKKIALVGFYPYQYSSYTSGRTTTTTATLNYEVPTHPGFQFGKPLDQIPSNGIDVTVPPERVKEFAMAYLTEVKRSGSKELDKMIEVKGSGDTSTFHLKSRDVDYYIVGIHGPAFDKENGVESVLQMLATFHVFILSGGTIPYWSTKAANTEFHIYDKNLNFITKKSYRNRYTVLSAWWGNENEGTFFKGTDPKFANKIYEPDVADFALELPSLIQK
ncbi:hypothetical protein P3G55_03305 [Leptospira sp. 96542]|nr:hypothetical protein [Leptospira sp. 96542]